METIISKTPIRFKTSDVNGEWVTDLASNEGDRIGYHIIYDSGYEYLIAYESFPITAFNNQIVTHTKHYERRNSTKRWSTVEDDAIDKTRFPNGRSMVTDKHLYYHVTTNKFYHDSDPSIYIDSTEEQLNENGESFDPKQYKKKIDDSKYKSYYDYIRMGPLGRAIESAVFQDIQKRFE